jgi:hypothetical protein
MLKTQRYKAGKPLQAVKMKCGRKELWLRSEGEKQVADKLSHPPVQFFHLQNAVVGEKRPFWKSPNVPALPSASQCPSQWSQCSASKMGRGQRLACLLMLSQQNLRVTQVLSATALGSSRDFACCAFASSQGKWTALYCGKIVGG